MNSYSGVPHIQAIHVIEALVPPSPPISADILTYSWIPLLQHINILFGYKPYSFVVVVVLTI